jgi:hypothetical protein
MDRGKREEREEDFQQGTTVGRYSASYFGNSNKFGGGGGEKGGEGGGKYERAYQFVSGGSSRQGSRTSKMCSNSQ